MNKPAITTIFWDWHGTLSKAEFSFDMTDIFARPEYFDLWMRGQVTADEVMKEFAPDYSRQQMAEDLGKEWRGTETLNHSLMQEVRERYPHAVWYIVTDNTDVFTDYFNQNDSLKELFRGVFNSADYGVLKTDNPSLYQKAIEELGNMDPANILAVDDSPEKLAMFSSLGGHAWLVEPAFL